MVISIGRKLVFRGRRSRDFGDNDDDNFSEKEFTLEGDIRLGGIG